MANFIHHDIITALGADSTCGKFGIVEEDGLFSVFSITGPIAVDLPDLETAYHIAFDAADKWSGKHANSVDKNRC